MHKSCHSRFIVSEEDQCSLNNLRVPVPSCEGKRILYLRQSNLLDSAADETYDRVTRMCSRHFNTGIALVSLLDVSRQWFKSRVGLDAQETSRNDAFCSYAVLEETPRVMVVLDALKDERFKTNPLVTGSPFIRFYAGASLIVDDVKIGTLCIIDDKPRQDFSVHNEDTLKHFADLIADLIAQERRRQLEKMTNGVDLQQNVLSVVELPLRDTTERSDHVESSWKHVKRSPKSAAQFLKQIEQFFKAGEILQSVVESSIRSVQTQEAANRQAKPCLTIDVRPNHAVHPDTIPPADRKSVV